ncbi:aldehyde:ferredoxin oxidoreductase [Anaerosolibacter carboniphilus]|uniref:Aldehyde:ferredoxin oxidoreductase n=1 Tax=Anaerosolibacter carboniphilus TaxID=1417629 RepID=A0A841KN66_9FIRM|nr:aldehyde ferredoxin oxidoreductase [Anaerosolibacter carboniphilus]MBB6214887.1 aldehyde:ferredoxin oxidoreductase [Anaerosolibacter carboniphilus]
MAKVGGWAGKILRVNLTSGKISTEDTLIYKDFIGGMGIGYKVMFNEVSIGTKPFDEKNKIIFGAGPLTGTGAPCSSRTNITSLLPSNPYHAVSDSHMGGNFAAMMKYAGWDAIIVEGASSKPVWLRIEDDEVSLEDASFVWGKGIFKTTAEIASVIGKEASIAAIGQAGENMVNLSVIMNGTSHSAGGHGGVMGSKKLKAIAIKGTGAVHIAAHKYDLLTLNEYMMKEIIGANNQHVVPRTPQPWAEYHNSGSRWLSRKGLFWGGAETPIETGENPPGDMKKIGFRTMKAVMDLGPVAEKYTVRMGGCQSCPIRCHSQLKVPQLEKYGLSPYVANTCMGYSSPNGVMIKGVTDQFEKDDNTMIGKVVGAQVADDYGVWCNYGMIGKDFKYAYDHEILKKVLPEEEYKSIPWDKLEAGDPAFLIDFYRRIAFKEGEFSHLGDGTYWIAQRWHFEDDFWNGNAYGVWSPLGFPKHHSNEAGGQVGAIISCMFNRDAQCHSHMNFIGSGLPIAIQKEIAAEVWGSPDAIDAPANYTPMNKYKAKFAKWSIIRNCLHDSLTLCNWMWPMTVSPVQSRNYRGDTALEAKYLSIVTGQEISEEELDLAGERIFTLHRALTVKQMGTVDMRNKHDLMCDWIFDVDPDKKPFTPGTIKMDRDDMQLALTMFYKEMGWDEKTGAPTKETLIRLDLHDVANQLERLKLLP